MDSNNKTSRQHRNAHGRDERGFFIHRPTTKNHKSMGGFGQTSSPQMRRPFSEEPSKGTNGATVLWAPKFEKGSVQELYFQGSNITTLRLKKWRWNVVWLNDTKRTTNFLIWYSTDWQNMFRMCGAHFLRGKRTRLGLPASIENSIFKMSLWKNCFLPDSWLQFFEREVSPTAFDGGPKKPLELGTFWDFWALPPSFQEIR